MKEPLEISPPSFLPKKGGDIERDSGLHTRPTRVRIEAGVGNLHEDIKKCSPGALGRLGKPVIVPGFERPRCEAIGQRSCKKKKGW